MCTLNSLLLRKFPPINQITKLYLVSNIILNAVFHEWNYILKFTFTYAAKV